MNKLEMIKLTGARYEDGEPEVGNRIIVESAYEYEAAREAGYLADDLEAEEDFVAYLESIV